MICCVGHRYSLDPTWLRLWMWLAAAAPIWLAAAAPIWLAAAAPIWPVAWRNWLAAAAPIWPVAWRNPFPVGMHPPPQKTTKIPGRKQFQGWSYMGNNNDILKKLKFKYCFTCKEKLSTFPNPIWTEQKYPERNQMVLLLMFSMFFRKQARAGLKAEIVLVLLL